MTGTVDEGETYETNIYKEAGEGIGLSGFDFKTSLLQYTESPRKCFIQWYLVEVNKPLEYFVPQESEVEKLVWIKKEKLIDDIKNSPAKYVPALRDLNIPPLPKQ